MKFCKRCLYPSLHPLNIIIDNEGICSGCRIHEEKNTLNWDERADRLSSILSDYKSKGGSNYDCIIPVSGARDSFFIVHTIKNIYGMNPLLVTYNKHYNTAVGYKNLAQLRTIFDCDILTLTVDPASVKAITRGTLRRFGSIYWHCLAGQTVFPVQIAVKFKIPLIVWGAHQGIDQVGMFSHLDEVEMTRKYRKDHDLMGFEAEELISDFDNIKYEHVHPYIYPDNLELEQIGVRGIYLNNFVRWDSRKQHEQMISLYNYESSKQNRTFDYYNDIDCWNYTDLHDYIKQLKYGYTKVLDHAVRDIRLGHLTRDQGIHMVSKYQNKKLCNKNLFFDWLGISENSFNYIIDQHRNPLFWKRDSNWEWKSNFNIIEALRSTYSGNDDIPDTMPKFNEFTLTDKRPTADNQDNYIIIGKGCF